MKRAPSARTRLYSSSVAWTRAVQLGSSHSQTNTASSAPKRSAVAAIRSLTSRNSDSVRATRRSSCSPIAVSLILFRGTGLQRARSLYGFGCARLAGQRRARRRLPARRRRRGPHRGVPLRDRDGGGRCGGCRLRPRRHRQVARVPLRRPLLPRARAGRPPRRSREGRARRAGDVGARRPRARGGTPDRVRARRRRALPAAGRRRGADRPAPARARRALDRRRLDTPPRSAPRTRAAAADARDSGRSRLRRVADPREGYDCGTRCARKESSVQATEKIWLNGEFVDWDDAKIHVGSHGLHYGTGVFEGIRCYETPDGPAVFRLRDHLQRLHNSARLLYLDLPYGVDELRAASMELVTRNGLPSCYLRPIAFVGYGELGVAATGNPIDVAIMSWAWAPYLGEDSLRTGIRAAISSWQRVGPNVIPHVAKATGIYLNSMLATTEARRGGYDEAILLTADGYVADGPGENVFVVKDGVLYTPDLSTGILPGITRDTIVQIAQDLGYTVVAKNLIRSDLHLADEAFMCGTAAEVTPLREIDDVEIGVGEITLAIQKAYLETVKGESDRWAQWREPVENFARAQA